MAVVMAKIDIRKKPKENNHEEAVLFVDSRRILRNSRQGTDV
jgi:hypothetical protein